MLEEDYAARQQDSVGVTSRSPVRNDDASKLSQSIIRELLIPEIEKEVNEGETFTNLRQIYSSMILATWYKAKLKDSFLRQVYIDQNKTKGVDTQDKEINQKIYNQYIEAFNTGHLHRHPALEAGRSLRP